MSIPKAVAGARKSPCQETAFRVSTLEERAKASATLITETLVRLTRLEQELAELHSGTQLRIDTVVPRRDESEDTPLEALTGFPQARGKR